MPTLKSGTKVPVFYSLASSLREGETNEDVSIPESRRTQNTNRRISWTPIGIETEREWKTSGRSSVSTESIARCVPSCWVYSARFHSDDIRYTTTSCVC